MDMQLKLKRYQAKVIIYWDINCLYNHKSRYIDIELLNEIDGLFLYEHTDKGDYGVYDNECLILQSMGIPTGEYEIHLKATICQYNVDMYGEWKLVENDDRPLWLIEDHYHMIKLIVVDDDEDDTLPTDDEYCVEEYEDALDLIHRSRNPLQVKKAD